MANSLYTTLFHVFGIGASCTFEDDEGGEAAMRLAMDLERQGYVVKVYKQQVGNTISEETIYESDNWVPVAKAEDFPKKENAQVTSDGTN